MLRRISGKGLVFWMNILSPSILAADFSRLGEQIKAAENAGATYLHIDVMDGVFVPSISFGMPVIASIRNCTELFFDVHLMLQNPQWYIKEFVDSGADLINFHLEAVDDPKTVIGTIRGLGKKVGITIKPSTPASAVKPYLRLVDMVLVMTVEPGFGGQDLIPECLHKVSDIRKMVIEGGLKTDIEVDGGIRIDNVERILEAGANVIVSGSAVFHGNVSKNVKAFMDKLG